MIKGFKVRLYPTKEQENLFWQHIGCCRFIWNWMLDMQQANYQSGGKYISAYGMIKLLTPLKNDGEHDWLYGVSNASLQNECKDVDFAFKAFFRKQNGYPKYKSRKRSKSAFPVDTNPKAFYFLDKTVQIPKAGKVKYKTDFTIPQGLGKQKFSNVRITYTNNKWILSFGMECENQVQHLTDKSMGIDLGTKELAIVAFDDEHFIFHNINKSRKIKQLKSKLKHTQRTISRKYEASKEYTGRYTKTNNILREEEKLRRLHMRIANIRHNYIHQTTHALVAMMPKAVVMEDLNVSGMMKNKHLSKAIGEQCWYEFIRQMKYKCEWSGIEFVQADRFYPSSKTCSSCGNIKHDLKLSDRTYTCPECGFTLDRDVNAAINLMRYAA